MYELTDIIIDESNGFKAIVINDTDNDGFLVGYLNENKIADDIDGNIQYINKAEKTSHYKKPNFEELKQYVAFRNHLLDREIEIYEREEYDNIDFLISNLKGFSK